MTAFTVLRVAINMGWAFGLGLGGLMAERSFGWLFVGDAITSVGFGLIALLFLPQGVRTRRHEEPARGTGRAILADRGFLLMMAAVFLVALVYMQTASAFSLQVRDAGFSKAAYGGLLAMNGILIVFLELPITTRLQRGRGTRIIATGNLLVGLGFALTAFSTRLGILVSVILFWTLGEMLAAPRSTTFVADQGPQPCSWPLPGGRRERLRPGRRSWDPCWAPSCTVCAPTLCGFPAALAASRRPCWPPWRGATRPRRRLRRVDGPPMGRGIYRYGISVRYIESTLM